MISEGRVSFRAWLLAELRARGGAPRGWSIRGLAARIHISQAAISGWIREDDPAEPSKDNIAALADVLGVHVNVVRGALGQVDLDREWSPEVTELADKIEQLPEQFRQVVVNTVLSLEAASAVGQTPRTE